MKRPPAPSTQPAPSPVNVTRPKLSIIIPVLSYEPQRNLKYLFLKDSGVGELLSSIRRHVTVPHETILVINNREDENLLALARDESRVTKYCINSVNVGVARAWNMGAMMAEGDILCWSNDDVVVGSGAVERLIEVLESDATAGEVGAHGGKRFMSGPRAGHCERMIESDRVEEADEISGYFFLTKRHVFEEVGGFDNAMTPCFYEEIDYSFKVRAKGYKCLVVPGVDIAHRKMHGVSAKKVDVQYLGRTERTDEISRRNHEYFVRKWNLG
jgi:GT2 family glycosyltransferase